jgi:hypothetical protein
MAARRPVPSPMVSSKTLMQRIPKTEEEASAMIGVPYREAIGALLYLSIRTRPEIAVAVGTLAKNVKEPRPINWEGVKRILRYLKETKNKALVFQTGKSTDPLTLMEILTLKLVPQLESTYSPGESALYIRIFDHRLPACTCKKNQNTTAVTSYFINNTALAFLPKHDGGDFLFF